MKENAYILSFDIGSTGLKAVLSDREGNILNSKYQQYETYYSLPTWIEQKPEDWWNAVCITSNSLLKESGIDPSNIKAVVPIGHQIMAIPVDQNGTLLMQSVLYCFDGRSVKQAKKIIDRLGGYENFYKIHGLAHPPEILAVCKAMWIKDNELDIYKRTFKFLQSKGFIILNLTDKKAFTDDYGDASNTGWLDIKDKKYSKAILDAAEIDIHKLPDIYPSNAIAGYVGEKASRQTGLAPGTPVFVGSGDVPASSLGAGVVKKGMHFCSIGSANWNGGIVEKPLLSTAQNMVNICHVWKDFVSFQYTSAGCISKDWFEETVCDAEKRTISEISTEYYDIVGKRAQKSSPGAKGLLFHPYLRGGGGPHWNPNSRGSFIGLSMAHNKNDMARAVLEGVALNFRWMMEETMAAGVKVDKNQGIRVIGGGARNEQWVQIYADVLGTDFHILKNAHEATAMGGFLIGAVGLGWYKDYEAAADSTVQIEKTIKPNMENHAVYNEIFPVFVRSFQSVESVFENLAFIQEKYGDK